MIGRRSQGVGRANAVRRIHVRGIPERARPETVAVCRSRLIRAVDELLAEADLDDVQIVVGTVAEPTAEVVRTRRRDEELTVEERAKQYRAQPPLYRFNSLVLPVAVREDLLTAVAMVQLQSIIFVEWGLKDIEPFPSTALNFEGDPGTGKTLAAHAVADYLGRPILAATYAQIESKYHGDGAKNVEALFFAAQRDRAVLFIDEAETLLSKRVTNVTQGSEHAINSMRSQLLTSLQQFQGIVIFATNLFETYDRGFISRVRHVHFPAPDEEARRAIWGGHLPAKLPLAADVSVEHLARIEGLTGRDIKNAIIEAASRAALAGADQITPADLAGAAERLKASRAPDPSEVASDTSPLADRVRDALAKKEARTREGHP
jgi:ATPase family associated with various cellular activities (AAA)